MDQPEAKAIEYPERSNFSSAQSFAANNEAKNPSSLSSHDTVGHVNPNHQGHHQGQGQENGKKSATFFMTQVRLDIYIIKKLN